MKLNLITLDGEKLDREVYEVQIPTASGEISVFDNHEPLITIAVPGVLEVRVNKNDPDSAKETFAINGGAVQIQDSIVKILVDEAESAEDIVEKDAKEALERAKELRANAKNAVDVSEAEAMMNRASVRLKVADIRRRRHRM